MGAPLAILTTSKCGAGEELRIRVFVCFEVPESTMIKSSSGLTRSHGYASFWACRGGLGRGC